jgi:transcription antitermination protein NusB
MANRHLSRSVILQTLFEWDFKGKPDQEVGEMLNRNADEFAPGLDDLPFMEGILNNVVRKKEVIDQVIEKAAPEWPIDKINAVDRNILRMGLAELLFGDHKQVPPKVSINEAIELAKMFGSDSSSRFINGVLGAVYKEMGEPGKDQKSKRQMKDEPVDISKLPIEQKAGAVVYAMHEGNVYLALVHDVFGYWTLSKGGVEPEDETAAAAVREIKEEMGIDVVIKDKLGDDQYVASHPEKGKTLKKVTFFLAEADYGPLTLESSGGLDDAKWFTLNEVTNLKMYDSVTALIAKAIPIITDRK